MQCSRSMDGSSHLWVCISVLVSVESSARSRLCLCSRPVDVLGPVTEFPFLSLSIYNYLRLCLILRPRTIISTLNSSDHHMSHDDTDLSQVVHVCDINTSADLHPRQSVFMRRNINIYSTLLYTGYFANSICNT